MKELFTGRCSPAADLVVWPPLLVLWETALSLLADGRTLGDLPGSLRTALSLQAAADWAGTDEEWNEDLGALLQRLGVSSSQHLRATFSQFAAAMAAMSLAFARQSQNEPGDDEQQISPALIAACLGDIGNGLWAEIFP